MTNYPKINDCAFGEKITKLYGEYKIPKQTLTFDDICFPKKFQLQLPQKFLSEFMNPSTPYRGVLVYHRIGAGKTCTAVRIAETWRGIKKIIVLLPASLKGNFRSELRSQCADNNYLTASERIALTKYHPSDPEYKEIIKKSDERIDKVYHIYSYNKFIQLAQSGDINLRNTLLIIDEIQNMV